MEDEQETDLTKLAEDALLSPAADNADTVDWGITDGDSGSDTESESDSSTFLETPTLGPQLVTPQTKSGPPPLPPRPQHLPRQKSNLVLSADGSRKFFKIVGSYRRGVLQFIVEELLRRGFRQTRDDALVSVYWSRSFINHLSGLQPDQKVNFFPGMAEICRKDFLNRNIKRAKLKHGNELFDFWPVGFNLPTEMAQFKVDFVENPAPFILKPPLAARGEGIQLLTSLDQLEEMQEYIKTKIPLAQRYIPNPMLFHGHKMTFRLYVAITSWDPVRAYVYPNGLVRICSAKYATDTQSFENKLVHLTNYDLQMDKEADFNAEMPQDAYHDGLRSELKYILSEIEKTKGISAEQIWSDLHKLVACSILSEMNIQPWVAKKVPFRNNCFEILGYDVLIDETGKPWLLEINHTPSLSPHTEMENGIKRAMLKELMDLVDIGNSSLQGLIRIVDRIDDALRLRRQTEPERYEPKEQTWKNGELNAATLTRADIWSIVDSDLENRRKGSWIRVLPSETDRFDKLYLEKSRNSLLSRCVRKQIGIAELAEMAGLSSSQL